MTRNDGYQNDLPGSPTRFKRRRTKRFVAQSDDSDDAFPNLLLVPTISRRTALSHRIAAAMSARRQPLPASSRGAVEPAVLTAPQLGALWAALRAGHAEAFFQLLRAAPGILGARDEQGACVLHWFALAGCGPDDIGKAVALGVPVRRAAAPALPVTQRKSAAATTFFSRCCAAIAAAAE